MLHLLSNGFVHFTVAFLAVISDRLLRILGGSGDPIRKGDSLVSG